MKKLFAILASIGIILNFAACSSSGSVKKSTVSVTPIKVSENKDTESEPENKSKSTVSSTASESDNTEIKNDKMTDTVEKPDYEEISIGQTLSSEKYDFTLNKVEFSYQVTPDAPPSYYTYYDAPENQVYIYVNADVKNKQKQSVRCDEIYSVTVDYDNGYTYNGFNIADDTDGDFTYANITSVSPLQTLGVHCLIACPTELETSDKPIILTIAFKDGTKYKYNFR